MTEHRTEGLMPTEVTLQYKLSELGGMLIEKELILADEHAPNHLPAIVELCSDQVERLEMGGNGWGDRHIEQLQGLHQLSYLRLSLCNRLTDEALFHLSKIASLRTLDLSGVHSRHFTTAGFLRLARLPHLDLLRLPRVWPVPPEEDLKGAAANAAMSQIQAGFRETILKK